MSNVDSTVEHPYDAAIVGGGPAGLSAAIVLGRCRRRTIVFDHGQPRNYASHAVHCFLGQEGVEPSALRELGRKEARSYGVEFVDAEVTAVSKHASGQDERNRFEVRTSARSIVARTLLLATGIVDELPNIPGFKTLYGRSVHHCPFCDGWEHRDERLVAFGNGENTVKLALELCAWSPSITACTNGQKISADDRCTLEKMRINLRDEKVIEMVAADGRLRELRFDSGPPLVCDALFFSTAQAQRSRLAEMLGVEQDDRDLMKTQGKQHTRVEGLFMAGDSCCDVQFAIVAAAEGAVAAAAINKHLQDEDIQRAQMQAGNCR